MIQAERTTILAEIERLMCRDEELLSQINGLQQHLGSTATAAVVQGPERKPRLYAIEGGKKS